MAFPKKGSCENESNEEKEETEENEMSTQDGLFSCPVEGCIRTFQKHFNLESHLSFGKCQLVRERNTLLDKAKILYEEKLSEGASEQPHITPAATSVANVITRTSLAQGWALKTSKSGKRFDVNQKGYLDEKFALGQETGLKADPEQVARDMRHAKTDNGGRRFKYEEFLSSKQIKSYFSRRAAKIKRGDTAQTGASDDKASEDQSTYTSARYHILSECQIIHPVLYDTYNLCNMYQKDKLKRLSVALLRHICVYFDLPVDDLPEKRKAPYINLISELVQACTCGGKED